LRRLRNEAMAIPPVLGRPELEICQKKREVQGFTAAPRGLGVVACYIETPQFPESLPMKNFRSVVLLAATLAVAPAFAQTKPSETQANTNMQILADKIRSDKKLVVAANMQLTDAEGKGFWPVYDEYQKELQKINGQLTSTIKEYAAEYNANTLTNEKAIKLLQQTLAIEEAETKLKKSFVPKLSKVLSGAKVARYLQIENKIRTLVKYELISEIPLVQ
jgi:hypothetical protein